MEKTLYVNFTLEGEDVDKIDVYASLTDMAKEQNMDFVVKSGNSNLYYTSPSDKNIIEKK